MFGSDRVLFDSKYSGSMFFLSYVNFGSQQIKIKISEKLIRILQVRIPYGIRNTTSILLKSSCAVTGNRHNSKEI